MPLRRYRSILSRSSIGPSPLTAIVLRSGRRSFHIQPYPRSLPLITPSSWKKSINFRSIGECRRRQNLELARLLAAGSGAQSEFLRCRVLPASGRDVSLSRSPPLLLSSSRREPAPGPRTPGVVAPGDPAIRQRWIVHVLGYLLLQVLGCLLGPCARHPLTKFLFVNRR